MTLNFVCRASKARKDGQSPIELSIIINGERSIITLDKRVNHKHFNPSTQRVKGNTLINEYLDIIRKKCYEIELELLKRDNLNLETFVHSFKHGIPRERETLLDIYERHNKLYEEKVKVGVVTEASYVKYINNRKRLVEYLHTLGMPDIKLKDIKPSFVENFQTYCLSTLKNATTNKQLKMLKKILAFAVKEKLLDVSPFHLVLSEEKKDYDVLTIEEVKYLMSLKFTDKRIESIRDCFCLQALTGLAYSDLASLSKDDITDDVIIKRRKKTNVQSVIPILPTAKRILEKYDYQLPVISNQKYNQYLKVLGDYAKLPMSLHSHLARHSYACILINSGVDLKTISRALGHANTKITESTYAFMNKTTIVNNILNKIKI